MNSFSEVSDPEDQPQCQYCREKLSSQRLPHSQWQAGYQIVRHSQASCLCNDSRENSLQGRPQSLCHERVLLQNGPYVTVPLWSLDLERSLVSAQWPSDVFLVSPTKWGLPCHFANYFWKPPNLVTDHHLSFPRTTQSRPWSHIFFIFLIPHLF